MKTLVIGAGYVGAHIIQQGLAKNTNTEFYLLDINKDLQAAQLLDLKDATLFCDNSSVHGITFDDPLIAEMDVIVITAGANQGPGETRCDLLNKNASVLKSINEKLGALKSSAIIVLVTNPVDVVTKIAQEVFPLPASQIIGTGTLLDSARLRWRVSELTQINIKNVHGYVLGEHGDSEFVAWSTVNFADQISDQQKAEIENSVMTAAYAIIEGKGATYFGIGAATVKILNAILNNTHELLPVSTEYPHFENDDLRGTPIGIPAVIGSSGVESVPLQKMTADEMTKLESSTVKLRDLYRETFSA